MDIQNTNSYSWIYSAKKEQLVTFLCKINLQTEEIFAFFPVDELRKAIVKYYKLIEQSAKSIEDLSVQSGESEEIVSEADSIHSWSDCESETQVSMEKDDWTFNPKKEDWEVYVERMEMYFEMKDIKKEKKVAHLLAKVGMEMYKRIRDLCAPDKPKDKTYEDLIKLVQEHLSPKKNEAMERCKFQQARQAPNESIAEYVEKLKTLSLHCNFGTNLKTALRDQLVCGLADHDTRVALFSEANLDYDKAVQIATTREAAVKNAACTQRSTQGSSESTVKKVNENMRRNDNFARFKNDNFKSKNSNFEKK